MRLRSYCGGVGAVVEFYMNLIRHVMKPNKKMAKEKKVENCKNDLEEEQIKIASNRDKATQQFYLASRYQFTN